jgi:putative ABC transport system permease protein
MTVHPPRLAVWLLTKRLSAEWREFVLGDLEEEFRTRCTTSPSTAHKWFWRQTIRCLAAPPPRGRRPLTTYPSSSSGDSIVQTLLADLRHSVRSLSRTPSFALAVVAVLALGIGVNTAIFSIVNAVLLRPLPFEDPERLVQIFHVPPQSAFPGMTRFAVSSANFYDWQRDAQLFEGMAMFRARGFALSMNGNAEGILAGAVGTGFFEITRGRPLMGRVFLPEEDDPGREHVAILSEKFWRSHLGAAADAVGRTLKLDGEAYSVVGVMPARFSEKAWRVASADIWVPIALNDRERAMRDNHNQAVVARLKPGISVAQATSEMQAISQRLEREYPQANTGWGATVIPLQELIVGDIRPTLIMLLAAVGLVLLIACANVGNLLFARGLGRSKELAIRSALGAGRARVFQQLLVEALVLAAAGGVAGLLLARASLIAAPALLADQVPRADEISIDGRVLLFVLGASMVTAILAGALPALRAGRTDLNEALKEGGRSAGALGLRTRRLVIVSEVALSVMLLMGAGVMFRTLVALRHVEPGFDPHQMLTMTVVAPPARYATPVKRMAFFDAALTKIRALPGVLAAGGIDTLPVQMQGGSVQPIVLEGRTEQVSRDQPTVAVRKITPGYLSTMRVPLLRGRDIVESDAEAILISRGAAKVLWGDADPIGRRVTLPLQSKTLLKQIVGIVGDVRQGDLSEPAMPTIYEYTHEHFPVVLAVAVRTSVPPESITHAATAAFHSVDPELPVRNIRTMDDVLDQSMTSQRLSAFVLGLFAALALALASVGIYSVLSYIVRGRSREIGIRTALGARTRDVLRLIVSEGMTPTFIGIAAGAVAALGSARLMEKLVFGVSASDPLTLAAVAVTLALVALLASLGPAYRASRLDPLEVLRAE